MLHCFAYGTLMCEDIMEEVSGSVFLREPGILKGFIRRVVRGEFYPGIVPMADCEVAGVVYREVPEEAWRRLDVALCDGKMLSAGTYVVKPEYASRLDSAEWSADDFIRNGKSAFRQSYTGYAALKTNP